MYTLKKIIICVFLTQFAVGCSASLPEQCKQLKEIQEAYTEKKDPVPSRQFEILSEQFSKKSKDIEKLSISDKDLKGIQQRFTTNYDSQAKFMLTLSAIIKQKEMLDSEPKPSDFSQKMDKTKRLLELVKQGDEPQNKLLVLGKEYPTIVSDMEKICSIK
jgi:hypothetical protein